MLSVLSFGSCYGYSPGGVCQASRRSRALCARLKAGDADFLVKYALRVRRECSESRLLDGFFAEKTILVPVPASVPSIAGALTVAERLARALVQQGLGAAVWPGLRRDSPVRKSATALAGTRPTVEDHYSSLSVTDLPLASAQLLLIDDVVTKGRTLLAAAARLQEAFPHAHIRAFALLRTMSLISEIDSLVQPCVGEIRWRRGDARRSP
jgi:hypothetical protein